MRTAWLGVVLLGCTPVPPEACVPDDAPWVDADGDGFPVFSDCDDLDGDVHPNAFDLCDGVDNNCDGEVDEGWPDYDGDGTVDCRPDDPCNGVDDDGDGRIDEGHPDFDGDGVADCLDDVCDTTVVPGDSVIIDEDCEGIGGVTDAFNVRVMWEHAGTRGAVMTPVVGNLTDDNGDGKIDDLDTPDVAVISWGGGQLDLLNGADGSIHWSFPGMSGLSGLAMGDIDADGEPELVGIRGREVVAISHTGAVEWTAPFASGFGHPAIGDLDADGVPEVVFGDSVYDGATGAVEWSSATRTYSVPIVGDINDDGLQEVLMGDGAYDHTGKRIWARPGTASHPFMALADLDGDRGGESVWAMNSTLLVLDDDGATLVNQALKGSGNAGPPSVADFDGDGQPELCVPRGDTLQMYERDGTLVWTAPIDDGSGFAGASGFDLDGDGAVEVLYRDQDAFRVYDGATGKVLYEDMSYTSATSFEYPIVVDVDNDGTTEILVASSPLGAGTGMAVTVYAHDGGGWLPSGPTWPMHGFAELALDDDLSVPSTPPMPWLTDNVFRARSTGAGALSDLTAAIVDVCASGCEDGVGTLGVQVQLSNIGARDVSADVPVSLYALDGGVEVLLATEVFRGGIVAGRSASSFAMVVPIEATTADGLIVRAGDDGSGEVVARRECDASNNTDTWPYDVCGP